MSLYPYFELRGTVADMAWPVYLLILLPSATLFTFHRITKYKTSDPCVFFRLCSQYQEEADIVLISLSVGWEKEVHLHFVILPKESFSPESGGRVNPRTAIEAMSTQGTIRLKK